MKKPETFMIDDENPEWTAEDYKNARPLSELMPNFATQMATLSQARRAGRPAQENRMKTFTLRMPASDIPKLRAKGAEQTREFLHKFANS